jgi:hypothetical protein
MESDDGLHSRLLAAYEITAVYRVQLLSTEEDRGASAVERPRWDDFFTGECLVKMAKE